MALCSKNIPGKGDKNKSAVKAQKGEASGGSGSGAGWEGCLGPLRPEPLSEPAALPYVCVFLAECVLQPFPRKGDCTCGAVGQWEKLVRQHPGELLPPGGGPGAAGWEAHRRL